MSSPLFRLPLELREHIYAYVIATREDTISPFIKAERNASRVTSGHRKDYGADNVMPLLQSGRQVYEEASGFLYGQHTFLFDTLSLNHHRSKWLHPECIPVNVTGYCEACQTKQRHEPDYFGDLDTGHITEDGKHFEGINRSDVTEMQDWLIQIGPRNRSFLRKLRLQIKDDYCTAPLSDLPAFMIAMGSTRGAPGGELFQSLLRYIDNNLSVREVRFSFDKGTHQNFHDEPPPGWLEPKFASGMTLIIRGCAGLFLEGSRLRRGLTSIRSLQKLKIDKLNFWSDWIDDSMQVLREYASMEVFELMETVQSAMIELKDQVNSTRTSNETHDSLDNMQGAMAELEIPDGYTTYTSIPAPQFDRR